MNTFADAIRNSGIEKTLEDHGLDTETPLREHDELLTREETQYRERMKRKGDLYKRLGKDRELPPLSPSQKRILRELGTKIMGPVRQGALSISQAIAKVEEIGEKAEWKGETGEACSALQINLGKIKHLDPLKWRDKKEELKEHKFPFFHHVWGLIEHRW